MIRPTVASDAAGALHARLKAERCVPCDRQDAARDGPVRLAICTRLEANWDAVQLLPAACEEEAQEHCLDALDGQRVSHDVACRGHDAGEGAVLRAVEAVAGAVVVLEGTDVLLPSSRHMTGLG
jgi:hypothetical protein